MSKQIVTSPQAPAAIGPYSQAVQAGGFLFLSGQLPLDPQTMQISGGDASLQADRVMANIGFVLQAAGLDFADIVKVVIYLTDLADFAAVNETYARYLQPPFPARTTVQVAALPRGARIEIEATAQLR